MTLRGERAADALALGALKLGLGAWILHTGFTHVSDDDYARTAIAEGFAHAPRLDPSATSWLPFPFWLEGTAMMAAGRSLAVARGVALFLGAAAVAAPYLAMRAAGMKRAAALVASAVAMALPYGAWLGAATVPEGWTGAITAAALVAMAPEATGHRTRLAGAVLLLAASLSRYDAWPACAAYATFCALEAIRHPPRSAGVQIARRHFLPASRSGAVASALVAIAGPVAWMAWNAHAHGSPTHFVTRVTTFRHAVGAASLPLGDKLLGYPRALLVDTPEVALLALAGLLGLGVDPALRARWTRTLIASAAVVAFLIAGDLGDGAPTHHPARALSAVWWLAAATGIDAASAWLQGRWRVAALALASLVSAAWLVTLPGRLRAAPGESEAERRDAQIERGLAMRARGVAAAEITPCAFEHFALIAAWGAPERATLKARTGEPVTDACPRVEEH